MGSFVCELCLLQFIRKASHPVWTREDAKTSLDLMPTNSHSGLRDRALIAAMLYCFARVGAVLKLKVNDYYHGSRRWLRLHEKGGKEHEMPVHHLLEEALKAYIAVPQASKADNSYSKA